MALVVEDGTGLSNAEAYASAATADVYHAAHGAPAAWTASTADEKDDALRIAGEYLQVVYGGRWRGQKNDTNVNQALDFPRKNMVVDDYLIPASGAGAIPTDVVNANIILANKHREAVTASTPTSLIPDESNSGTERRRLVKVGPITKDVGYATANPPYKRYRIVDLMLRRYLNESGVLRRS